MALSYLIRKKPKSSPSVLTASPPSAPHILRHHHAEPTTPTPFRPVGRDADAQMPVIGDPFPPSRRRRVSPFECLTVHLRTSP
nr:hypothetical protein Itr_chr02CG04150 [Ipomoea trifida]